MFLIIAGLTRLYIQPSKFQNISEMYVGKPNNAEWNVLIFSQSFLSGDYY